MGIIKNGQQFRYGLQTALCFAEGAAGLRFSYFDENMDVDKKSNYRLQNSGFWNQSGYELHLITRHRIGKNPFWGGLLLHYRSTSDNARHWIYQAQLSNTEITGSYFGGGLAYSSPRSRVKAALEYRHGVYRFDKNDLNSKLFADGLITDRGIHCGLEYAFTGSLFIRNGYQVYRNKIHPDLLIFSEFNKSHWNYVCAGGIGYLSEKIRLECHVQYTFKRQIEAATAGNREGFLIHISTEILK
ncbi:hypothetical protein GF337_10735 [candidate division KSB1 bacterium]|nr:hypothetical protein [candidate division KSB1 bacterium]